MGFLFCLMFRDAHVQTSLWHWLLFPWGAARCTLVEPAAKFAVLFSSLHEICSQEKCELVQIILGKPENNINHLVAFRNKATLSQKEFYRVKVGPEVIYGNLLEILHNGLQDDVPKDFYLIFKFFKIPFLLSQVVFSLASPCSHEKTLVWCFMTLLIQKPQSGLTPNKHPVGSWWSWNRSGCQADIYPSLTEPFLWSQSPVLRGSKDAVPTSSVLISPTYSIYWSSLSASLCANSNFQLRFSLPGVVLPVCCRRRSVRSLWFHWCEAEVPSSLCRGRQGHQWWPQAVTSLTVVCAARTAICQEQQ